MRRLGAALIASAMVGASPAAPAALAPAGQAELRRGFAAAGPKTSEEPALRAERASREPSAAFMLGAALGAWINAAEALDYDLKNPSGDGDDSAAIAADCYDETTAFAHLESRRQAMEARPAQVLEAAGVVADSISASWRARQSAQPAACR